MKTIKVMIAASQEMHDEELKFTSLIKHLNKALAPRGIELKRVKWDPEVDGTINDYLVKLQKCEMCLTLYWKQLADNSEKVLQTAYDELKSGNNPRKIYVFFKEPSDDISESLKDFKENFVTNYGHFFCRFENADTINLHFILQFEAYQNTLGTDFVKISDGKVMIGDKEFANLDNIPFASMNKEYHRLQSELMQLDLRITELRQLFRANPENEDLEDKLMTAKSDRKKLADEFANYQQHLYDVALNFAKLSEERYTERIRKARELFESGYVVQADEILNLEEMKQEKENELKQFEQHRKNLELKIEEFCLKADTVLANTTLPKINRFKESCDAYEQAIEITGKICITNEKLADIYRKYAIALYNCNQLYKSIEYTQKALDLYRLLANSMPEIHLTNVVKNLNDLTILLDTVYRTNEAENCCKEAIRIINKQLAESKTETLLSELAKSISNLAGLHLKLRRYDEAGKEYQESLKIRRELAETNPDVYLHSLARELNNIAIYQSKLLYYLDAKRYYDESIQIRRKLAETNPDKYLLEVAESLNNIGTLKLKQKYYDEAKQYFEESLAIYKRLSESSPELYLDHIAGTICNLAIISHEKDKYNEADELYKEAIQIFKRLAKTNPEVYLPRVSYNINNRAINQSIAGNYDKAVSYYEEVLQIRKKLAESNPDVFIPEVAEAINSLAVDLTNLKQYDEAEIKYLEALDIFKRLSKSNPIAYLPEVARILKNLADCHFEQHHLEEAKKYFQEALPYYELLEKRHDGFHGTYIWNISTIQQYLDLLECPWWFE